MLSRCGLCVYVCLCMCVCVCVCVCVSVCPSIDPSRCPSTPLFYAILSTEKIHPFLCPTKNCCCKHIRLVHLLPTDSTPSCGWSKARHNATKHSGFVMLWAKTMHFIYFCTECIRGKENPYLFCSACNGNICSGDKLNTCRWNCDHLTRNSESIKVFFTGPTSYVNTERILYLQT